MQVTTAPDEYIDVAGDITKLEKNSQGGFAFLYTIHPGSSTWLANKAAWYELLFKESYWIQIPVSQLVLAMDCVAGMETQPALDKIRCVSENSTSIDSLVQVLPREPVVCGY